MSRKKKAVVLRDVEEVKTFSVENSRRTNGKSCAVSDVNLFSLVRHYKLLYIILKFFRMGNLEEYAANIIMSDIKCVFPFLRIQLRVCCFLSQMIHLKVYTKLDGKVIKLTARQDMSKM